MAETPRTTYLYTVLREVASDNPQFPVVWVIVGTFTAKAPLEAEKAAAGEHGAGKYQAVSRWEPTVLRPKVVTTFEIGDVTDPVAPVVTT